MPKVSRDGNPGLPGTAHETYDLDVTDLDSNAGSEDSTDEGGWEGGQQPEDDPPTNSNYMKIGFIVCVVICCLGVVGIYVGYIVSISDSKDESGANGRKTNPNGNPPGGGFRR